MQQGMGEIQRGKLLTTKEVAEFFGPTAVTVSTWLREKRMNGIRTPTGYWRVSPEELERFTQEAAREMRVAGIAGGGNDGIGR